MSARKQFEEELLELKTELVKMCRLTESMIETAIRALLTQNPELGQSVSHTEALAKQPDTIPEKFEVGSLNTPAIASLYHSIKWLLGENIQQVREIEKQNYEKLYKILKKYANIRMYGLSTHSVGIISCTFEGLSPDNVERILAERNVAVRTGLHCAPNAHKFLGTFPAGTVRFSVSYFTTDEDFAQLEEALDYIEENS